MNTMIKIMTYTKGEFSMMKTKYTLEQLEEMMNKNYKGELDFNHNSDLVLHDYDLPENLHVKGDFL